MFKIVPETVNEPLTMQQKAQQVVANIDSMKLPKPVNDNTPTSASRLEALKAALAEREVVLQEPKIEMIKEEEIAANLPEIKEVPVPVMAKEAYAPVSSNIINLDPEKLAKIPEGRSVGAVAELAQKKEGFLRELSGLQEFIGDLKEVLSSMKNTIETTASERTVSFLTRNMSAIEENIAKAMEAAKGINTEIKGVEIAMLEEGQDINPKARQAFEVVSIITESKSGTISNIDGSVFAENSQQPVAALVNALRKKAA